MYGGVRQVVCKCHTRLGWARAKGWQLVNVNGVCSAHQLITTSPSSHTTSQSSQGRAGAQGIQTTGSKPNVQKNVNANRSTVWVRPRNAYTRGTWPRSEPAGNTVWYTLLLKSVISRNALCPNRAFYGKCAGSQTCPRRNAVSSPAREPVGKVVLKCR